MTPETRRSEQVVIRVRPRDMATLREVADAWGLYPAEVAFGVLTDVLAQWRGEPGATTTHVLERAARYLIDRERRGRLANGGE